MDTATGTDFLAVPDTGQLERWIAERLAHRHEFLRRCVEWSVSAGGVLTWPDDQAAILEIGVPCDECVTVVHLLYGKPRPHRLVVTLMPPSMHWSDGISAHCGGMPAYPGRRAVES